MSVRPATSRVVAFATGVLLALVTCGGIVEERLSSGDPRVALVANLFITLASVLVFGMAQRRTSPTARTVVPQALGAACAIAAVHVALRAGIVAAPAWLSERPAELVNDVVAVFATLAVVWSCARGLSLPLFVTALVVLTAYRATGRFWHLDAAPHGFVVTVQDCVLAQVIAAAIALLAYRAMTERAA